VIFRHVAHEPAYNNGCGLLPKKSLDAQFKQIKTEVIISENIYQLTNFSQ
jgi:hypothetical protein